MDGEVGVWKVQRSGAGACGTTYYLPPYAATQEPRKSEGGWGWGLNAFENTAKAMMSLNPSCVLPRRGKEGERTRACSGMR